MPIDHEPDVTAEEFRALFSSLSRWGTWGAQDDRGALHFITPERVAAAAALVRDGITVTMSLPLNTHAAVHNPKPADHHMTAVGEAAEGIAFNKDYVGLDYHNDGHTHLDALCHVAFDGHLYNGRPEASVDESGAEVNSVEVLAGGLVGRGVLLDIPGVRSVDWLEPGENVFAEDLKAAESAQGVQTGEGDILLVRTGHARRLAELGPWDTGSAKAGLHPDAMPLISERRVAALGSDGNSDTAPSSTEGVDFPIHVLALTAMGVHLLDYLSLEDLTGACRRLGRWEFMFVAIPLLIPHGTGSPINPIAMF